jgi:hypothetical protein
MGLLFVLECFSVEVPAPPKPQELQARAKRPSRRDAAKDTPTLSTGSDDVPVPPWLQQRKGRKRS